MEKIRIVQIGLGLRGIGLYYNSLKNREDVQIVAVCDCDEKKRTDFIEGVKRENGVLPDVYADYKKCIFEKRPQAAVISASWTAHTEIAVFAMEQGVAVASEVGGAFSLDELWSLVHAYERTNTPVMLLENCCYGRLELLALHMKRLGALGTVIACAGGYCHDLREEIAYGKNYRLQQYMHRNCENYPTHEIGPIAKLLDINAGNRFVSLYSAGSASVGISEYVREKKIDGLSEVKFNQSDIVTTIIRCQNGETVTITLDTCNPRYYSRGFYVRGSKGIVCEENRSVYLEKDAGNVEDWSGKFNNLEEYYKKYEHPIWKNYCPGSGGHGGMDKLVFDAFFNALKKGLSMPIDVYDMVTWMSVSVLSEQSLATGQAMYFPDFTNGKWVARKNDFASGDNP